MPKIYRHAAEAGDAWLIPGDLHIDQEDPAAVLAMREWWDLRRQSGMYVRTGVGFQGDTFDCYGLNRFGKRAKKYWSHGKLMQAVDRARPFLQWATRGELGAWMILGNHEFWIRRFLDDAPALEGCPGLEFGALTGLNDIEGLEILDYDTRVLLGDKVVVMHGHGSGCKTASGLLTKYPDQTTVMGHLHHIESKFRTVYGPDGTSSYRSAHIIGMLASDEAVEDYAPDANMQRGFAVIEFFGKRNNGQPFYRVEQHAIVKDSKGVAHVA